MGKKIVRKARTGQKVTFSFGASGALAKQLSQGAPFDLFAGRQQLVRRQRRCRRGACERGQQGLRTRGGHIVVWSKHGGGRRAFTERFAEARISKHIATRQPRARALRQSGARSVDQGRALGARSRARSVQAEKRASSSAICGKPATPTSPSSPSRSSPRMTAAATSSPSIPALAWGPSIRTLVVCKHGKSMDWRAPRLRAAGVVDRRSGRCSSVTVSRAQRPHSSVSSFRPAAQSPSPLCALMWPARADVRAARLPQALGASRRVFEAAVRIVVTCDDQRRKTPAA